MNIFTNDIGKHVYRDIFGIVNPLPQVFFHGTSKEYVDMNTKDGFYQRSGGLWLAKDVSMPLSFSEAARHCEPGGFTPYFLIVNASKARDYAKLYPTDNGHFGISQIELNSSPGFKIQIPNNYRDNRNNILLRLNKDEIIKGIIQCLGLEKKIEIAFESIDYTKENLAPIIR